MDKDAPAPPADPLAGLVDIPLPAAVSLWPQTWASRIAIVLLVAGLFAAVWWLVRRHIANRYRRAALAELGRVGSDISALAVLVRRTALAAFPRTDVAALSGLDWLSFLDRSYGGTGFSQGPGRALATAAYEPPRSSLPPEGEGAPKGRKGDVGSGSDKQSGIDSGETSPFRRFAPPSPSGGTEGRAQDDESLVPLVRRWIRTHNHA